MFIVTLSPHCFFPASLGQLQCVINFGLKDRRVGIPFESCCAEFGDWIEENNRNNMNYSFSGQVELHAPLYTLHVEYSWFGRPSQCAQVDLRRTLLGSCLVA